MKVVQILEGVSGRAVAEVLQDEVFGPAGVANARLAKVPGDLMDVEMGGAGGYHPGWVYHGLVVGTVSDAARVLWMLVHGRLLRAETFEEMLKGRALPEHHPDAAYGLGLMLRARETKSSPMGHTGEGPGGRIAVYANGGMVAAVWVGMPSEEDAEAMALGMIG
jgi:CubicO group peptidase (beta-lactamase class C family)